MARELQSTIQTAVGQEIVETAFLIHLGFDSGTEYLWSGSGDMSWNGHTYVGAGEIGQLSGVTEGEDMKADVMTLTLNHIPTSGLGDLMVEITTNDPVGRPWSMHLATMDEGGITASQEITSGFMGAVSMRDGAVGGITIELVNEAVLLNHTHIVRMDNDNQQNLYAGDLGCQFVTDLDDEIMWGKAPPHRVGSGGSGMHNTDQSMRMELH